MSGGQPRSRADPVHDFGHRREELVGRGLRVLGDEAVRVDAEPEHRRIVAGAAPGLAVELDERRESLGHAADDRQRHRQTERAGADGGLRRAADRDPHRKRRPAPGADRHPGR